MLKSNNCIEENEEEEGKNEFIQIVYKYRNIDQKDEYQEIVNECLNNGFSLSDLMLFQNLSEYTENVITSKMKNVFDKVDNVLNVLERHSNYKIFAEMACTLYKLLFYTSEFVDFCKSSYCEGKTKMTVNKYLLLCSRAFIEIDINYLSEGLNNAAKNLMNEGLTNDDIILLQKVYSFISNLISAENDISEED